MAFSSIHSVEHWPLQYVSLFRQLNVRRDKIDGRVQEERPPASDHLLEPNYGDLKPAELKGRWECVPWRVAL